MLKKVINDEFIMMIKNITNKLLKFFLNPFEIVKQFITISSDIYDCIFLMLGV